MNHSAMNVYRDEAERALSFAASQDFAGRDPYDGLLSPLARILPSRLPRQVWVQLIKRQGEAVRRISGIPKVRMSKSLALFSMAAANLGNYELANRLADDLLAKGKGGPWGYEFDVQTRWAHYPAGSPNVIATSFAIRALSAVDRLPEVSDKTREWLRSLRRGPGYFAYTPMSDRLIHNGSLLAAESLMRLGETSEIVSDAVEVSVNAQRADGSWPYGSGKDLDWIDNFHTAYVLESLHYLASQGLVDDGVLQRGVSYWLNNLFLPTGEPLYFASSKSPSTDIHNVATAAGAMATLGLSSEQIGPRGSTLALLRTFQANDGAFRNHARSPVFMRWNQAHATYALSKWISQ